MYRSHTNDRGRRDNGRRDSYQTYYANRDQNNYRDSWHGERDRYEDDRYHTSNDGRREDDYGPFSNIYDNDSAYRGDFDTRYNDKDNYYYDGGPRNNRSDEARGQSLSDVFNGSRQRGKSDREYFTSYRSGDENRYERDPHYSLYGSEDSARYNRHYYNNDDRREDRYDSGNEWREREWRNDDRYDNRGQYRNDDPYRNMRNDSGNNHSYSGDANAFNKRRRYNEGYLY